MPKYSLSITETRVIDYFSVDVAAADLPHAIQKARHRFIDGDLDPHNDHVVTLRVVVHDDQGALVGDEEIDLGWSPGDDGE